MVIPMAILITILNIYNGTIICKYGHVDIMLIVSFLLSAASNYFYSLIDGIIGISIFTAILNNRVPYLSHDLEPSIAVKDVDMKFINTYGPNGLKTYNDGLPFNYLLRIPYSLIALVAYLCSKNVRVNKKPQSVSNNDNNNDDENNNLNESKDNVLI